MADVSAEDHRGGGADAGRGGLVFSFQYSGFRVVCEPPGVRNLVSGPVIPANAGIQEGGSADPPKWGCQDRVTVPAESVQGPPRQRLEEERVLHDLAAQGWDASSGGRVRPPDGAGAAGPLQCPDHDDPHACLESREEGRPEPGRRTGGSSGGPRLYSVTGLACGEAVLGAVYLKP